MSTCFLKMKIKDKQSAIKLIKKIAKEFDIPVGFKHSHTSNGYQSLTYTSWHGMKQRCLNPNHDGYKNYGGRGIKICERWINSFENFLEDMGERPSRKYQLNRIDNDGDYTPKNCEWVTAKKQIRNSKSAKLTEDDVKIIKKLLTGKTKQYMIAKMFNVSKGTISAINCKKTWR